MFIVQLHQEPFLFFFLLVLVLSLLYEVLWLGDEEDGGGNVHGQLPPHLARAPIHCCLVENIFILTSIGFFIENMSRSLEGAFPDGRLSGLLKGSLVFFLRAALQALYYT